MTLYRWDRTTPANNATADATIDWTEGQAPSSVNNSARAMMTAVAKYRDDVAGTITTAGTSTAYTFASNQVFTTLAAMNGAQIAIVPHVTCGATVTLNVDGLGAKPLRTAPGVELAAGNIVAGTVYLATYNNSSAVWYLNGVYNIAAAAMSITTAMLADGAVTTIKIADANVTTAKILDANVTTGKIADGNVTLAKVATDTGNKGKLIGYDQSTGVPTTFTVGGSLLHVREQQAAAASSTSPVTGSAYSTRILNTSVTNEISGASLSSNQITLPAGTYFCQGYTLSQATSSSNSTGFMRCKLFNVTGTANLVLGSQAYGAGNISFQGNIQSNLNGRFTLAGSTVIDLRAYHVGCAAATSAAINDGDGTVYTDLMFWKIS